MTRGRFLNDKGTVLLSPNTERDQKASKAQPELRELRWISYVVSVILSEAKDLFRRYYKKILQNLYTRTKTGISGLNKNETKQ